MFCPLGACAPSFRCSCESLPNSPTSSLAPPVLCHLNTSHLGHAPLQTAPSPLGCIVPLRETGAARLLSPRDPGLGGYAYNPCIFLYPLQRLEHYANWCLRFVVLCEGERRWLFVSPCACILHSLCLNASLVALNHVIMKHLLAVCDIGSRVRCARINHDWHSTFAGKKQSEHPATGCGYKTCSCLSWMDGFV